MKKQEDILKKFGFKKYNFGEGYFHYEKDDYYFVINYNTKHIVKFYKETNEPLSLTFEDVDLLSRVFKGKYYYEENMWFLFWCFVGALGFLLMCL
ncbi:MAG: hypothetical protein R3Y32_06920 [Bacillota bacterium]